jgi:DNA-binding MarR family transcriptional regulator
MMSIITKGGSFMLVEEAAERIIQNIYPLLYFALPRAPSRLSPTRLNERQISILCLLEQGSLTVGEIGDRIHLALSPTSKMITNLENKGLVKTSRSSSDKRRVDVEVTGEGKERFNAEKEKRKKWFEKILSELSDGERIQLVLLLEKITKAIAF